MWSRCESLSCGNGVLVFGVQCSGCGPRVVVFGFRQCSILARTKWSIPNTMIERTANDAQRGCHRFCLAGGGIVGRGSPGPTTNLPACGTSTVTISRSGNSVITRRGFSSAGGYYHTPHSLHLLPIVPRPFRSLEFLIWSLFRVCCLGFRISNCRAPSIQHPRAIRVLKPLPQLPIL